MAVLTTTQEQSPGTNGHKALLLGCTTSPKEHESNCSLPLLSKIICPHMVKKEKNDSTMKESTEESRSQMFDYSELINSRLHQMKSYECWDISTQKVLLWTFDTAVFRWVQSLGGGWHRIFLGQLQCCMSIVPALRSLRQDMMVEASMGSMRVSARAKGLLKPVSTEETLVPWTRNSCTRSCSMGSSPTLVLLCHWPGDCVLVCKSKTMKL